MLSTYLSLRLPVSGVHLSQRSACIVLDQFAAAVQPGIEALLELIAGQLHVS